MIEPASWSSNSTSWTWSTADTCGLLNHLLSSRCASARRPESRDACAVSTAARNAGELCADAADPRSVAIAEPGAEWETPEPSGLLMEYCPVPVGIGWVAFGTTIEACAIVSFWAANDGAVLLAEFTLPDMLGGMLS